MTPRAVTPPPALIAPARGKPAARLAIVLAWGAAAVLTAWSVAVLCIAAHPTLLGVAGGGLVLAVVAFVSRRFRKRSARAGAAVAAALLGATVVHLAIRPHAERAWVPDMSRTPHAEIQGDVVTIHEFRNFSWSTEEALTKPRWETRTFHLSQLRGVDLVMVYWGSPHMSHTMASFDFGAEGRVCVSIEARRETAERYSPTLGALRKYELLHVLGAESDLIRLRTNLRAHQTVRLFPLRIDVTAARRQFLGILEATNRVHASPAWYHTVRRNCTTEILLHELLLPTSAAWNWRLIANGHLDEYLRAHGYLDSRTPLASLRLQGDITARARTAAEAEFSAQIRVRPAEQLP